MFSKVQRILHSCKVEMMIDVTDMFNVHGYEGGECTAVILQLLNKF